MIRRRGGAPQEDESSSDEEDAFSALTSSQKAKQPAGAAKPKSPPSATTDPSNNYDDKPSPAKLPVSKTSSMKRHHHQSDLRKAKMDALLQQMKVDNSQASSAGVNRRAPFIPDKKGSFVQPGEEHLTTNIFVGNLAPSITEEEMTDLFRQFGDLYSLKIMWPRTPEERARNRHTGFVCFMNRADAQDAMEACDETDPFNVGRRIMMRWGKNVKKISGASGTPFATKVKSLPSIPDAKRPRLDESFSQSNNFQQNTHKLGSDAIRIVIPKDHERARFITTIASFVAKDGSLLEQRLIANEFGNPKFQFLTLDETNEGQKEEHLFYKWRVYAFCQGDGFDTWRMEPFVMFQESGRYWIPPPVDRAAAMREEQATIEREQRIRQQKAQRQRGRRNDFMTGRQLEQQKYGAGAGAAEGGARMTDNELKDFHTLTCDKLCASREAICNAMAYCFEKSGAAKQIADLLKELLMDDGPGVSVDTRIARLYLLSDVLYNSQQPGVRNAFLYRDAIERMAPDVFASLGKHGDGKIGRMTFMKLKSAVSSILSAWTNWSVYNPAFIDELEARFDGREVLSAKLADTTANQYEADKAEKSSDVGRVDDAPVADSATVLKPRGDWKEVSNEAEALPQAKEDGDEAVVSSKPSASAKETAGEAAAEDDDDNDSDVDGEPLEDDDLDGESLSDEDIVMHDTADGVVSKSGEGGQENGDEELDGEPLDSDS